MAEMARRVLAGETIRGLVMELNQRGVSTVTGRPWSPTVLRNLLLSPRIAGLRQHRGQVIGPAVWVKVLHHDAPIFPSDYPGLLVMPAAFIVTVAVSLATKGSAQGAVVQAAE